MHIVQSNNSESILFGCGFRKYMYASGLKKSCIAAYRVITRYKVISLIHLTTYQVCNLSTAPCVSVWCCHSINHNCPELAHLATSRYVKPRVYVWVCMYVCMYVCPSLCTYISKYLSIYIGYLPSNTYSTYLA